jgi:hypothetical protein
MPKAREDVSMCSTTRAVRLSLFTGNVSVYFDKSDNSKVFNV